MNYESRLQDDYLEMLIRYMKRQHETDHGELWWELFREDYPASAADLETWLEDRHET